MRYNLTWARDWLQGLSDAAYKLGVPVQWCMSFPRFVMQVSHKALPFCCASTAILPKTVEFLWSCTTHQALTLPAVTNGRASDDSNKGEVPHQPRYFKTIFPSPNSGRKGRRGMG